MLENMLNDICGSDYMLDIYTTLSVNLFSPGGKFSAIYSFAKGLYNAVMPVGVYLLFIYFLVAIVDKCSSEQFSWEQLWRLMGMLLASKFIMEHGFEILEKLFGVGLSVTATVSRAGQVEGANMALDTAAILESFRESLGFTGLLKALGDIIIFLMLLIPWVISWIIKICVNLICYSRMIEIYLRIIYAPIPLSDFFANGMNGTGWKYLKSFLAIALQGAMILGIGIIYSALFSTLAYEEGTNILTFFIPVIAISASCVMLMFRSLTLCKEIVGAV